MPRLMTASDHQLKTTVDGVSERARPTTSAWYASAAARRVVGRPRQGLAAGSGHAGVPLSTCNAVFRNAPPSLE